MVWQTVTAIFWRTWMSLSSGWSGLYTSESWSTGEFQSKWRIPIALLHGTINITERPLIPFNMESAGLPKVSSIKNQTQIGPVNKIQPLDGRSSNLITCQNNVSRNNNKYTEGQITSVLPIQPSIYIHECVLKQRKQWKRGINIVRYWSLFLSWFLHTAMEHYTDNRLEGYYIIKLY